MDLKEKLVYICHEFGGRRENIKRVTRLVRHLVNQYPEICFLSPVHATGFLYHELDYEEGMEYCLTLLDMCDEMWTFGSKSMSRGCMIEKEYCKKYKIPIIERGDYDEHESDIVW
ncbi:MAG TPA: DUF4406 domain-containing protein [Sphingobacteriaceae bacterium]|nr:DUF4406 domain-containing protein [Sphingobacteriaceae bacterium]